MLPILVIQHLLNMSIHCRALEVVGPAPLPLPIPRPGSRRLLCNFGLSHFQDFAENLREDEENVYEIMETKAGMKTPKFSSLSRPINFHFLPLKSCVNFNKMNNEASMNSIIFI